MIFLELFYTFFIIGLFTIGGGYAMLPLIQHKVCTEHAWITDGQFTDMIAISQMTPGPIGINSATYVGYSVIHGWATGTGTVGTGTAGIGTIGMEAAGMGTAGMGAEAIGTALTSGSLDGMAGTALVGGSLDGVAGTMMTGISLDGVAGTMMTGGSLSPWMVDFLSILGSFTATLAVVLPSFLIVLALCKVYTNFCHSRGFTGLMMGLRPTVAGLIGAAAVLMITPENFPDWKSWLIFAASFIAAMFTSLNPILLLVAAGAIGFLVY